MKKNIIALVFMLLCSSAFADIIFQQDFTGPAVELTFKADCFNTESPKSHSFDFDNYPEGISASLLYEFNSKNQDAPLHYYLGASLGFFDFGFPITLVNGVNWKLGETSFCNISLNGEVRVGDFVGIKGGEYGYLQSVVDFVFTLKKFPKLYLGAGLTTAHIFAMDYMVGYGMRGAIYNYASPHFAAGFRF